LYNGRGLRVYLSIFGFPSIYFEFSYDCRVAYDVSTIFSLTISLMANHVHSFLGHESDDLLYIYEMFLFTGHRKDIILVLYTVHL